MGLLDEIKRLTKPYAEDEEEFEDFPAAKEESGSAADTINLNETRRNKEIGRAHV